MVLLQQHCDRACPQHTVHHAIERATLSPSGPSPHSLPLRSPCTREHPSLPDPMGSPAGDGDETHSGSTLLKEERRASPLYSRRRSRFSTLLPLLAGNHDDHQA